MTAFQRYSGLGLDVTALLTGTPLKTVDDPRYPVKSIRVNGSVVGVLQETEEATICLLGDMHSGRPGVSRTEQAQAMWALMEEALTLAGLRFSDVVRTWLYVDHILEWYDELNRVRDTFFRERKVFDGVVPASTGVGVANPYGAALVADVLAIRPKQSGLKIAAVPSPLQCPALAYGSSFSRAVEVASPGARRLLISGTASIEPGGATSYAGDIHKQVKLSMDVVHAILTSRGMDWNDVSRSIAYFRDIQSASTFTDYCSAQRITAFPCSIVQADICRSDLLFEIEADALITRPL